MRLACLLIVLAACHPLYRTDAEVVVPPEAIGRSMAVIVYPDATYGGQGLPALTSGRATLIYAGPATADSTLPYSDINCDPSLYVAAWVDVNATTTLGAELGGTTIVETDYGAFDSEPVATQQQITRILAMTPGSGAPIGVAGPLDFGPQRDGSCQRDVVATTVTVDFPTPADRRW